MVDTYLIYLKKKIMNIDNCIIEGVKIIEPSVFEDERGFFFESYHQAKYKDIVKISEQFVQDNHSKSAYGVLRGLHFQKNMLSPSIKHTFEDPMNDSPNMNDWARPSGEG